MTEINVQYPKIDHSKHMSYTKIEEIYPSSNDFYELLEVNKDNIIGSFIIVTNDDGALNTINFSFGKGEKTDMMIPRGTSVFPVKDIISSFKAPDDTLRITFGKNFKGSMFVINTWDDKYLNIPLENFEVSEPIEAKDETVSIAEWY